MTLSDGLISNLPRGFARDVSRTELGQGKASFLYAREAMIRWVHFDLEWVSVANSAAKIAAGETIAVLVRAAQLWSLNISRIIEAVDTPARFGFLYATTAMHVETGQERFLLEFDEERGLVAYLIEAVSRPRHPLARLAYPFTRAMQHRFARESHARLAREVASRRVP